MGPGVWVPVVGVVLVLALVGVVRRSDASEPAGPPLPQWLFTVAVGAAQDRVADGNAVTLVSARRHRDRTICALLGPSRRVHDWLGTLHGVSTDAQQGEVTVALDDGVMLHTADRAKLRPGSTPFEKVADLHDGDQVRFSGSFVRPGDGTCINSTNLFAKTGVTSPDFVFRFNAIRAAQ
ncbi:hypothetical protein D9V37_09005 [Nocardioides mangrovicus]|uniref:Uncharacterized protein n=1 Tax=Nocardioides mangrovicus TaxID=2478913 RepID=A0A3L8P4S8_9ACTN|nr:hypothetical protein D9V37_09005 [Nocardioides mangrovicus]